MNTLVDRPFVDGGKAVVHGLRRALAEVLTSVGANPAEPQEISRRFGLDKTLTWKVARVVGAEDAWDALPHIPRRPSVQILVQTLSKHGAAAPAIEGLWRAVDEFERFVEVHSGDRETLEMMVGGASKRASAKRMEAFRKSGFQCNSAVWGIRTGVHASLHIMTPVPNSDMLDLLTVCGVMDFRRLRPVPWAIASAMSWDSPESENTGGPMPLELSEMQNGVPVLPAFCTKPLPGVRLVSVQGGTRRFEITEGPVGNTASNTVVLGWNWRACVSRFRSTPDEQGEHGMQLTTPAESVIMDLYIHRSLSFAFDVQASVYSLLPGGPQYPTEGRDVGRLPVPETVLDLGASPPDTITPEIPRYPELVEYATRKAGFTPEDFHGFRYKLKYPPIPSFIVMRHSLLPR